MIEVDGVEYVSRTILSLKQHAKANREAVRIAMANSPRQRAEGDIIDDADI